MAQPFWNITSQGKEASVDLFGVIGDLGFLGESVTAANFVRELRSLGKVNRLNINIHSEGGSVWDGLMIYRALRDFPAHKVAHVSALSASISSVIMLGADSIEIAPEGEVMIHNPIGGGIGQEKDFAELITRLKAAKNSILDIYERRTGQKRSKLSDLMDAETWMTGEEAKAAGFADVVKVDQPKMRVAAGPLTLSHLWRNAPERVVHRKPAPLSPEIAARMNKLGLGVVQ